MIWGLIALISVFQGVVFFGHWLIYKGLVSLLHLEGSSYLTAIKWGLFILSLTFSAATLLSQKFIGPIINWFYTAAAIWMGTLFWLTILVIVGFILGALVPSLEASRIFGIIIFVLGLLISVYGVWNSFNVQITSYTVALPNLPASWENKKIALIADTHFGNIRGKGSAEKFARIIAAQKPEMVLIPGDFYDGPPTDFETPAKIIGQINAPKGIYFSSGNHEEFNQDNSIYLAAINAGGIKVLDDQMAEVDGLQILGVPYKDSNTVESLKKLLDAIPFNKNKPSILLKHAPLALDVAAKSGISLEVSGHTHKGQMWPISLITKWMFKGYDYGMKNYENMVQITTSGAGSWGPPQRVGSKAEIVVITLVKK